MRAEFDFTPLYRSSIGFDRVFNLLNNPQRLQAVDSWPPYDIVKKGENEYAICLAVAGFSMGDLDVTQERNVLIVKGGAALKQEGEYLHRGISAQSFERRFELADHVHVEGASLCNGLLTVTLKREIPEQAKPRRIEIGSGCGDTAPLQIEAERQAA
ncbi:MAG: Hsp20 family protein [Rhizobiaceae bacterium]|nr:MAG: Hsp20 family protein [Rhizobiaceae bacterium]